MLAGRVNGVTEATDGPDLSTTAGKLADLKQRYHEAVTASGEAAIEKQHAKGKMTARERIAELLDPGSFVELDEFVRHRTHAFGMEAKRPYGDAVVTGIGTIHGRQVAVYAQDFTIFGGSLGEVAGEKIIKVMELALKTGMPIIGILDSGGARIQEGVVALGKYGEIFRRNTAASGVIPQISIIMRPGGRRRRLLPRPHRLRHHGRQDQPDVRHRPRRHQDRHRRRRRHGGARRRAHAQHASRASRTTSPSDEADAIDYVRTLISFLPDNNMADAPVYDAEFEFETTDDDRRLNTIIPDSPNQPYDIHTVIAAHRRPRRLPRGAAAVRAEHRHRLRPHRGTLGRHHREPAVADGRHAEHRGRREGLAASCGSATRSRSRS